MLQIYLYHHLEHTEVSFLADDPDNVALLKLTLGLDGAEVTVLVFHADHHAMVFSAEVSFLQGLTYEWTAFAQVDSDNGQAVLVLVALIRFLQFLFTPYPQRCYGFFACYHFQLIARIDAMAAAGDVDAVP